MADLHDVIIVGAGPGGSTAAYELARAGLDVLALDKATFPRDKTCGDGLTPRALRVLDTMGLLDRVLSQAARHHTITFVAPRGHTASADVISHDERYQSVAIVPRLILDNLLLEHAVASGAQFIGSARVTDLRRESDCMVVEAIHGKQPATYRSRLVIIATGASTGLLVKMGILRRPPAMMLACRAYYDGIAHLDQSVQCRFDGVPLPGYGWVFPLSPTRANIGAGIFRGGIASWWMPDSARTVFDNFLRTPSLRRLLEGAHLDGPVKGYPIRIDFARAPTYAERVLLIGEAAGLVNPVTGEGIDYAMESAHMAAEQVSAIFASGDFSLTPLRAYDHRLRQAYQRLFRLSDRLRLCYLNPFIVNRAVKAASHRRDLRDAYMNIVMENDDPLQALSPNTLAKVLLG